MKLGVKLINGTLVGMIENCLRDSRAARKRLTECTICFTDWIDILFIFILFTDFGKLI